MERTCCTTNDDRGEDGMPKRPDVRHKCAYGDGACETDQPREPEALSEIHLIEQLKWRRTKPEQQHAEQADESQGIYLQAMAGESDEHR